MSIQSVQQENLYFSLNTCEEESCYPIDNLDYYKIKGKAQITPYVVTDGEYTYVPKERGDYAYRTMPTEITKIAQALAISSNQTDFFDKLRTVTVPSNFCFDVQPCEGPVKNDKLCCSESGSLQNKVGNYLMASSRTDGFFDIMACSNNSCVKDFEKTVHMNVLHPELMPMFTTSNAAGGFYPASFLEASDNDTLRKQINYLNQPNSTLRMIDDPILPFVPLESCSPIQPCDLFNCCSNLGSPLNTSTAASVDSSGTIVTSFYPFVPSNLSLMTFPANSSTPTNTLYPSLTASTITPTNTPSLTASTNTPTNTQSLKASTITPTNTLYPSTSTTTNPSFTTSTSTTTNPSFTTSTNTTNPSFTTSTNTTNPSFTPSTSTTTNTATTNPSFTPSTSTPTNSSSTTSNSPLSYPSSAIPTISTSSYYSSFIPASATINTSNTTYSTLSSTTNIPNSTLTSLITPTNSNQTTIISSSNISINSNMALDVKLLAPNDIVFDRGLNFVTQESIDQDQLLKNSLLIFIAVLVFIIILITLYLVFR